MYWYNISYIATHWSLKYDLKKISQREVKLSIRVSLHNKTRKIKLQYQCNYYFSTIFDIFITDNTAIYLIHIDDVPCLSYQKWVGMEHSFLYFFTNLADIKWRKIWWGYVVLCVQFPGFFGLFFFFCCKVSPFRSVLGFVFKCIKYIYQTNLNFF